MNLIGVGLEILLKVISWVFNFIKASEEKKQWLAEVSETLRTKGWVRSKFIIEIEEGRIKRVDQKLQELEKKSEGTQ